MFLAINLGLLLHRPRRELLEPPTLRVRLRRRLDAAAAARRRAAATTTTTAPPATLAQFRELDL